MSAFKGMVKADIKAIFLNDNEFAERRSIIYDGVTYVDILIVLTGAEETERVNVKEIDHMEGVYEVSRILYCDIEDLDGKQPEQGTKIRINDREGGGGYFEEYTVVSSICEEGMLEVKLGAFMQ